MKADVKDTSGKALKKIELHDSIFGVELNDGLLHSVVKAYLANKRQGTHATKTRAFVSGGGKKPFKQKGTGEARQGSKRAPNQPGGAISHGPQPRDYRQFVPTKMRRKALAVALSDRAANSKLIVVDDLQISSYSTKNILKTIKNLGLSKALFVDERKDDFLYKSVRNIHGFNSIGAAELNAEDVLRHEHIVLSSGSLSVLNHRFNLS